MTMSSKAHWSYSKGDIFKIKCTNGRLKSQTNKREKERPRKFQKETEE